MTNIQIEAYAEELTNDYYYKKLQKELKEKRLKKEALMKLNESNNTTTQDSKLTTKQTQNKHQRPIINEDYFKDQVTLTGKELTKELDNDKELNAKKEEELHEKMKYNAKEIMRNYNYKIDFSVNKDKFIEMFKYNIQQSRSHNQFTAKFAGFKAGVVGQILAALGIPPSELKKIKKQSFVESFDENLKLMEDHVYHAELSEILEGKTRKTKRTIKLFQKLQFNLMQQMNNLGRIGFWSKSKLLETKIAQCTKIKQEFINEKNHLEYLLDYVSQQQKDPS